MSFLERIGPAAWPAAAVAVLAAAACGLGSGYLPQTGGVAPALVVERFLRAANADDLETMARLFGTRDGSILKRDPRPEVEQRMYALASFLKHQDYKLEGERIVPGRMDEAIQILVRLNLGQRQVVTPFTVLRSEDGWLIEQIDLEPIARQW